MTPRPTWIIVGAGYTGERLATALVGRGDTVIATRRKRADAEAVATRTGARPAVVDLRRPETLLAVVGAGSNLAITAPPDPDGADAAVIVAAAAHANARRMIYLSSTGVYAPAAGAWVDEAFPLAPLTSAGRARRIAETTLAAGAAPTVSLRVAGIYGPGRGVIARLRAGTYRLIGDGETQVSRIHVDDLVAAILAVGDASTTGPVYNVADQQPCSSRQLALAACALLDLPLPPTVPLDAVDADTAGMLTADRRIDASRLTRELPWTPRYPSWQDALRAEAC